LAGFSCGWRIRVEGKCSAFVAVIYFCTTFRKILLWIISYYLYIFKSENLCHLFFFFLLFFFVASYKCFKITMDHSVPWKQVLHVFIVILCVFITV
jgi:hypothetical protein